MGSQGFSIVKHNRPQIHRSEWNIGTFPNQRRLYGHTCSAGYGRSRNSTVRSPHVFPHKKFLLRSLTFFKNSSHWREKAFGPEMMTAFLSASYQPLSALSVEAFKDLGYTVDSSAADDFQVSSNGYNGGNSFPLPGETFVQPNWFNWDVDSFWNSTTIWIVSCVGVGVIVILLSCIYSRIKARRNARPLRSSPPTAMSSLPSNNSAPHSFAAPPSVVQSAHNNYPNLPTAVEVRTNPRQSMNPPVAVPVAYPAVPGGSAPITESAIRTVMDVTNCADRQLAYWYLREANGDIGLAIERYLQKNDRHLAVI